MVDDVVFGHDIDFSGPTPQRDVMKRYGGRAGVASTRTTRAERLHNPWVSHGHTAGVRSEDFAKHSDMFAGRERKVVDQLSIGGAVIYNQDFRDRSDTRYSGIGFERQGDDLAAGSPSGARLAVTWRDRRGVSTDFPKHAWSDSYRHVEVRSGSTSSRASSARGPRGDSQPELKFRDSPRVGFHRSYHRGGNASSPPSSAGSTSTRTSAHKSEHSSKRTSDRCSQYSSEPSSKYASESTSERYAFPRHAGRSSSRTSSRASSRSSSRASSVDDASCATSSEIGFHRDVGLRPVASRRHELSSKR